MNIINAIMVFETQRLRCVLSYRSCHEGENSKSTGLMPNVDRGTHLTVTKYFRNIIDIMSEHLNVCSGLKMYALEKMSPVIVCSFDK